MPSAASLDRELPTNLPADPALTYSPESSFLPPLSPASSEDDASLIESPPPVWSDSSSSLLSEDIFLREAPADSRPPSELERESASVPDSGGAPLATGSELKTENSNAAQAEAPTASEDDSGSESSSSGPGGPRKSAGPSLISAAPFELLRLVGRGGMGEVWEARQRSLGRRVAIKTIRSDALARWSEDASTRERAFRDFEQEALVAARLEHPNITPVHDLGTAQDAGASPLLAMKLVRGESWDRTLKADFRSLSVEDFLAKHLPILIAMGQAVAFAHSRGIVHRDLKPAQVVIGEFGETHLMDWGLAIHVGTWEPDESQAAWEARVLERLPSPATASNPAGTPSMMAPEQTESNAQGVGTWTDVYLLGGTLYWLLCGAYPHAATSSREAMRKAMSGEIETPSARVAALEREVPAELEALCLRALSKNPEDRVPSAKAFVEAIRDYLSGASKRRESEAMAQQAASDLESLFSEASRLSEYDLYIRRAALSDQAARALELWPANSQAARLRARNLADGIAEEIRHGDLLLARVHLKQLEQSAEAGFFGEGEVQGLSQTLAQAIRERARGRTLRSVSLGAAALLLVSSVVFGAMAVQQTRQVRQQAIQVAQARDRAERNLAIARQQSEGAYSLIFYILDELKARMEAEFIPERGLSPTAANDIKYAIAGGVASKAMAYFEGLDTKTWPRELRASHANTLRETGYRFFKMGRYEEGEKLSRSSIELLEPLVGPSHRDLALSLTNLASAMLSRGNWREAEPLYRRSLAILEKSPGPEHPETAHTLDDLVVVLIEKGDLAEAERLCRRVLAIREKTQGREHSDTLGTLNNLALLLSDLQKWGEAEEIHWRVLAIREKTLGPEHPDVATTLQNLSSLISRRGDVAEAEPLLRRAMAIKEKALGPDHPSAAGAFINLANIFIRRGEWAQAEAPLRRALAIYEKTLGPDDPSSERALHLLGNLLCERGEFSEAEPLLRRSAEMVERTQGPEHPLLADRLSNLATLFLRAGDLNAAEPLLSRALAIQDKALGPEHPAAGGVLNNLLVVHVMRQELAKARDINARLVGIQRRLWEREPSHPQRTAVYAATLNNHAGLVGETGSPQEAFVFLEECLSLAPENWRAFQDDPKFEPMRQADPERFAAAIKKARIANGDPEPAPAPAEAQPTPAPEPEPAEAQPTLEPKPKPEPAPVPESAPGDASESPQAGEAE
jgi:serine/threonine protein kinase/Tfp pilus assembly protein PilF